MKYLSLIFVSISSLLISCGDTHLHFGGVDVSEKKVRTISVTGSADMEVPPDEIELVIALTEFDRDKNNSIEKLQDKLYGKLEAAGVPRANISLRDVNNHAYWRYYWDWYYWGNPSTRPYITKQISVKMESMMQVDKVVSTLQMRGISNVHMGKTSNKNLSDYRRQVKLEAIKMAKEKADQMLTAIGESVGRVISIKEVDGDSTSTARRHWRYGYPYYYWDWPYYGYYGSETFQNSNALTSNSSMNASNLSLSGGPNSSAPEEGGMKKIKLRYEVEAVFEIKTQ